MRDWLSFGRRSLLFIDDFHVSLLVELPIFGNVTRVIVVGVDGLRQRRKIELVVVTKGF